MKSQLALLCLASFVVAVRAVKVDQPNFPDGVTVPEPSPPAQDDPADTLEDLEKEIFEDVALAEEMYPRRTHTSPRKCCKLGRQVAENGLFCNADLMQVQKRPNVIHRKKMKFHGPEVHGKTVYKDLMRRVEKCSAAKASKSMFTKCCEWQEDIMGDLEQCKTLLTGTERRECRRRVQSRQ
ncbi:uncharacterized protein [Asterias amurensis]|uniref:uncharacterized protein isoform X2 n=1 Tax=Asterias amurensis TaxID=7602 RepID=UPI003AB6FC92